MGNELAIQVKNREFERLQPRKSIVRTILNLDKEHQISSEREKVLDIHKYDKDQLINEEEYNKKYGKWFCARTG